MEKLWTVQQIAGRYGWAEETTIRRIRKEMRHIGCGKTMRVPESALREWEQTHMEAAEDEIRQETAQKRKRKNPTLRAIPGGKPQTGKHIVPRTREEAMRQLGYG